MIVADADLLAAAGLSDPEEILSGEVGEIVKAAVAGHEVRKVVRGDTVLFVKRIRDGDEREIVNEWSILGHLASQAVPAPKRVALVEGRRQAALVTEGVSVAATLEDALVRGTGPISRDRAARVLPALVRRLHAAGVNHRDLYLGHILVDPSADLWLVDLGRAERRRRVPRHRVVKDLAALDFSTPQRVASDWSRLRFLMSYTERLLPRRKLRALARAVRRKSARMRRHAERKIARGDANIHVNT